MFNVSGNAARQGWLFLHDINSDSREDLVVVDKNGQVRVALNQGDDRFGPAVDEYVIAGMRAQQEDALPELDVLGFKPGTNMLLSYNPAGKGELYASFIVPSADNIRRSWIDFKPKPLSQTGRDTFTADKNQRGISIFQVYDTHSQAFTAGPGDDVFHFRLSGASFISSTLATDSSNGTSPVDIVLNGAAGQDHIVFQPQENSRRGITARLSTGSTAEPVFFRHLASGETRHRLQLLDIENAIGTPYNDTLTVSAAWSSNSTLNGNGGRDVLAGGAGNDRLMIELGYAKGGSGTDTYTILHSQTGGLLAITENPAGEHSQIRLPGTLRQIQSIYRQDTDLCLNLKNWNNTLRILKLKDFYAEIPADREASIWNIRSEDGFSFQLRSGTKVTGPLLGENGGWMAVHEKEYRELYTVIMKELTPDELHTRFNEAPNDTDFDIALWHMLPEMKSEQRSAIPAKRMKRLRALSGQDAREKLESTYIEVHYDVAADRTLTGEKPSRAVYLQRSEHRPARIMLFQQNGLLQANYALPAFFQLALQDLQGRQVELQGADADDTLIATAGSGSWMTGNGGADLYLVSQSGQSGSLRVYNVGYDSQPGDILALPWRFADIAWQQSDGSITGRHDFTAPSGESVSQSVYLTMGGMPHLSVRDSTGKIRHFDRDSNGQIFLSDSPLRMKDSARLELTWASGRVTVDARSRTLAEENEKTVILDNSSAGNEIYGTAQAANVIRVAGNRNVVQGGARDDLFYSGTGADRFDGQGGQDVLYFDAGNGHDTLSGVEEVVFSDPLSRRAARVTQTGPDVRVSFDGFKQDSVTLTGYRREELEQVTLHFASEDGGMAVIHLTELMAQLPAGQALTAAPASSATGYTPVLPSIVAALK